MPLNDRLLEPGEGHIDPPNDEPAVDVPAALGVTVFGDGTVLLHLDVIDNGMTDPFSVGRMLTVDECVILRHALGAAKRVATPTHTERRNDRLN